MEEEVKKKLYNDIENPWKFVLKAIKVYKDEFRKTSKIGSPPKIDNILERVLTDDTEEELPTEEPVRTKEKRVTKKKETKKKNK